MSMISSVASSASQFLQQLTQAKPPVADSDGDGDHNAPDVATVGQSSRALDVVV